MYGGQKLGNEGKTRPCPSEERVRLNGFRLCIGPDTFLPERVFQSLALFTQQFDLNLEAAFALYLRCIRPQTSQQLILFPRKGSTVFYFGSFFNKMKSRYDAPGGELSESITAASPEDIKVQRGHCPPLHSLHDQGNYRRSLKDCIQE